MKNLFKQNSGAASGLRDEANIVRGVVLLSDSTRIAELAGLVGFETVWLDVEHGSVPDYSRVEALCVSVTAGGAVPTVRVPDNQRFHILRALEVGAGIVVVPMVNTKEQAEEVVRFGKFPPLGERGYNTLSRALDYGMKTGGPKHFFETSNDETHLFVQIESREAVENLDAICSVEGLSGIFIGPGDLSVSLGKPGQVNDPEVTQTIIDCVARASSLGKNVGILTLSPPLLEATIEAGCNFVFCAADMNELRSKWSETLSAVPNTRQQNTNQGGKLSDVKSGAITY